MKNYIRKPIQIRAGEIRFVVDNTIALILDSRGMVYRGRRVEDAGEAYRAFLRVVMNIGPHVRREKVKRQEYI